MKRTFLIIEILFLVTLLTITGCASTPQERVVVKTDIKIIKTPESLLLPCNVSVPPSKSEYVAMNVSQKESALTNFALDLLKDLRICNNQIKQISEFQTKELDSLQKIKAKQ